MAAKKKFVVPKNMAQCADLLYATREKRLSIAKQVAELEEQESLIKNYLIDHLPKSDARGAVGKTAEVHIETVRKPQVQDWDSLYKYVKKNDAFDLFQRRISEEAVTVRWEEGKTIPGVGVFNAVKVSCTKIKQKGR